MFTTRCTRSFAGTALLAGGLGLAAFVGAGTAGAAGDTDTNLIHGGAAVRKLVDNLGTGGDARAQMITLALVLGSMEAHTPKDAWRSATGGGWVSSLKPGDSLKFLVAQGYTLSDVEEVITGDRTADAVYDQQQAKPAGKE